MYVAIGALVLAVAAFLVVLYVSLRIHLIDSPKDLATVTGVLGSLYTLIGTVTGAYFGIKVSSDAADRTERAESAAANSTEKANRDAKEAALALNPESEVAQRILTRLSQEI